jgi:aerobic-type carbon monoxide dehydrogenase small subunit (CoxS/CutS family)
MRYPLHLTVNGEDYQLEVEAGRTLLQLLRADLGLTGTKKAATTPNAARAWRWSAGGR